MKAIILILSLSIFTACASEPYTTKDPKKKTITGILKHYPSNVKSFEALKGIDFKVGNTPVKPGPEVSFKDLMKFDGKKVHVLGKWEPGKTIQLEKGQAAPEGSKGKIKRGTGLIVEKIKLAK